MSTISLEPGVVVWRGCPIRQRSGSRLEIAPPLVAIALRHLAAKFDDLATLRHLNEDTACAQRSQSASERVSHDPFRACRSCRHACSPLPVIGRSARRRETPDCCCPKRKRVGPDAETPDLRQGRSGLAAREPTGNTRTHTIGGEPAAVDERDRLGGAIAGPKLRDRWCLAAARPPRAVGSPPIGRRCGRCVLGARGPVVATG